MCHPKVFNWQLSFTGFFAMWPPLNWEIKSSHQAASCWGSDHDAMCLLGFQQPVCRSSYSWLISGTTPPSPPSLSLSLIVLLHFTEPWVRQNPRRLSPPPVPPSASIHSDNHQLHSKKFELQCQWLHFFFFWKWWHFNVNILVVTNSFDLMKMEDEYF